MYSKMALTGNGKTEPQELPVCLFFLLVGSMADLQGRRIVRPSRKPRHVNLCEAEIVIILKDRKSLGEPEGDRARHVPKSSTR